MTTTSSCTVLRGRWFSRYDGATIERARRLHIDHVVALAEAWGSGARRWNGDTRARFANDLAFSGSLRAVSASTNLSKGDDDPAEWLPPRRAGWCGFVRDWIAIKWRWNLSVNAAERTAIQAVLAGCPAMTMRVTKASVVVQPPPSNFDPSYPTVCIPSPPPDLTCRDITFTNFTVLPPDPHGFDGNGNGVGRET